MPTPVAAVVYEVPRECPPFEAFAARVGVRAPTAVLVRDGTNTEVRVALRVTRRGGSRGRYAAELRVELPGAPPSDRSLDGRSCAEVVEGAALLAAMALPVVELASPPSEEEPPDPSPEPEPTPEPELSPEPTPRIERAPPRPPPRLGLGVDVGLVSTVGPKPASFLAVVAEWAIRRPTEDALQPRVRVSVLATGAVTARGGDAFASFALRAASLELCPLQLAMGAGWPRFVVAPCAGLVAGAVRARGVGIDGARGVGAPWVAPVAGGRARWELSRTVYAELALSAFVPLTRTQYVLGAPETGVLVHAVPALGGSAALGLGVSFL